MTIIHGTTRFEPDPVRRRTAVAALRDAGERLLDPEEVERIRNGLGRRGATLVSALAYAGLRPSEALSLRWGDVGEDAILVREHPWQLGREGTGAGGRNVRLLRPLHDDLISWRGASSHPTQADPVFPHRSGAPMGEADWRHWRHRRFSPAVAMAGLLPNAPRPLDLRHTFARLMIRSGSALDEVGREMGIDAMAVEATYRGVVEEVEQTPPRPASGAILSARKSLALSGAA
jgi:integrase